MEPRNESKELDLLERRIGGAWVTWAGVGFLLLALGYFFKYALDRDWISPVVRVGLGVAAGGGCYALGQLALARGYRRGYALTFMGLGIAALYTSFGSAYFMLDLLNPALGLLTMTAVTALAVYTAWHYDSQPLGILALSGALVAPVIFPEVDRFILQRFVYLFAVCLGAVALSVVKPWPWVRALAWAGAQLILVGHLVQSQSGGTWAREFGMSAAVSMLFALGLAFESLWMRYRETQLNLALSIGNAAAFAAYTAMLIPNDSPLLTSTLLVAGAFYGALAVMIQRRVPEDRMGAMLHLLAAATFLTVTAPLRLQEVGLTVVWTAESLLLWVLGSRWNSRLLQYAGATLWGVTAVYWYSVAWNVEWPAWFGVKFIPFINPGALAWIFLAAAGFAFSIWIERLPKPSSQGADMAVIYALASHVIVGGLLTIQINNLFEAYPLATARLTGHVNMAALSVAWGIYALLLVLWGLVRNSALFRWFGLAATALVLVKVFMVDLQGLDTVYKMIAFFLLGLIFLGIGFLYQRLDRERVAS